MEDMFWPAVVLARIVLMNFSMSLRQLPGNPGGFHRLLIHF